MALVSGCAAPQGDAAKLSASPAKGGQPVFASPLAERPQHLLSGGQTDAPQVQQLAIYQITVPLGAISRSEEFWKRVDEQRIDIATYDLLLKNGIRVGVGANSEWSYFKGIIDQYPAAARKAVATGGEAGAVELEMKKSVAFQNIFYLSDENVLYGRTYERCENLIGISFQPAPRKPGTVRMSVCPRVRSLRKRFEVSIRNEEREIEYVCPENLYDLNLIADVPLDGFLVIAPSTHAKLPSSLGSNFLVGQGLAEQYEQVILLVPQVRGGRELE